MKIVISIAIRGRPSSNSTTIQKLELGSSEYVNCITTVAKDSMVLIGESDNDSFCSHFENRKK